MTEFYKIIINSIVVINETIESVPVTKTSNHVNFHFIFSHSVTKFLWMVDLKKGTISTTEHPSNPLLTPLPFLLCG